MRTLAALLAVFALNVDAHARPPEVAQALPGAAQIGQARYTFLTLAVFDASLWAAEEGFAWERPFALSLTYRRPFSARALADQTLTEMSERGADRAGDLEALRPRLIACFADVAPGDRITAVSVSANSAHLYYNGAQRCTLQWPGLRRSFFGIWLDGRGEARAFSLRLRGGD